MSLWTYVKRLSLAVLLFVLYELSLLGYSLPKTWEQNKFYLAIIAITVLVTIALFFLFRYCYRKQLDYDNDWNFNQKPHWSSKRIGLSILGFVAIMALQIILSIFLTHGQSSNNQELLQKIANKATILFFIYTAFLAPIFEEFIFRGLFFNIFFTKENKLNFWLGIFFNGFLFGFLHDPSLSKSSVVYITMGMILALVYLKTKDLRYSIIVHILNNCVAVLGMLSLIGK